VHKNQRIFNGGKKKLTIGLVSWLNGYTHSHGTVTESVKYYKSLDDSFTTIMEGPGLSGLNREGKQVEAEEIIYNTIPETWDTNLWQAIEIGLQCEKRGLPFSIGWADHPAFLIDILDTYESAVDKWRKAKADSNGRN